ncbi:MAG: response regulator, partial [Myxococcota bacterium]
MDPDDRGLSRPFPILYVDDEEANRIVFEAAFGDELDIVCVASAEEALEMLQSRQFDVLITDQRMPGMTGVELCEQARERYPEMQRLILSAYTERDAVLQAINQGRVSGFLTKPWSADELRRALLDAQSLAHQSRLAQEIVAAMQIRNQVETQRQLLHDLANVASRVAGCCDGLEQLYPSLVKPLETSLA